MKKISRQSLPESCALLLQERISKATGATLPSIHVLARETGVSYLTMWRAVRILAQRGLVECRQGSPLKIRGVGAPAGASGSTARIVDSIREKVLRGDYRTGHALPKIAHLCAAARASRDAVIDALRQLSTEHVVHKAGKFWIAGPRPAMISQSGKTGGGRPVVLMLFHSAPDWFTFFNNAHTAPFAWSFGTEMQYAGIELRMALVAGIRAAGSTLTAGIDSTQTLIRSLGARYRGTLILHNEGIAAEFGRWLALLDGLDMPAVCFDPSGTAIEDARRRFSLSKRYSRLHLDERAAVACAISSLAARGHTAIGFPYYENEPWMARRLSLAREVIDRGYPDMTLVPSTLRESLWKISLGDSQDWFGFISGNIDRFLDRRGPKPGAPQSSRAGVFAAAPSIAALFEHGATAIVAPNDRIAHEIYLLLQRADVRVPREISMVGFDNIPEGVIFPLSTVDFGFARLGYFAAHSFIGDIPVRPNRDGNLAGICTLVDRGSVSDAPVWPKRRS